MPSITYYHPGTGALGPIISTDSEAALDQYRNQPGVFFIEGSHDVKTLRLNLETKELEPYERPPDMLAIRSRRDSILDGHRWTITPDSPLTEENQQEWLAYLRKLQRITVDYPDGVGLVWPEKPEFIYAPLE